VPISIDAPSGAGKDWSCVYEIGWPAAARRKLARGNDAMQASRIAMELIGVDLYTSDAHLDGRLRWDGSGGGGYGFPVTRNLRDRLVGIDKQFDG